jgi:hypothetical protein
MNAMDRDDLERMPQAPIRNEACRARWENTALILILYVLFVYALFPGRFDSDSVAQYFQGITFNFHDWLSPVMSLLLGIMRPIAAGPAPMFVVQLTLFFIGVLFLSDSLILAGYRHCGQASSFVMATPLVTFNFLDVQKDALPCGLTVFFVGVFARSIVAPRPVSVVRIIAVLCIIIIMLDSRKNSILLLIPICFGIAYFICGIRQKTKLVAIAGLLLASSFVVQQVVVYSILQTRQTHALSSLIVFDLAGITSRTGQDVSAGLMGNGFLSDVQRCYTPKTADPLCPWGPCKERGVLLQQKLETNQGLRTVIHTWLKAIAQHPQAYLSHRWAHFAALMRISCANCDEPMNPGIKYSRPYNIWQPDIQIDYNDPERITILGLLLERMAMLSYFSIWSRGFLWMIVLAVVGVSIVIKRRRGTVDQFDSLMATVSISGLCYSVGFFLVGVSSALRYLHVVYALGLVSFCLLLRNIAYVFAARDAEAELSPNLGD